MAIRLELADTVIRVRGDFELPKEVIRWRPGYTGGRTTVRILRAKEGTGTFGALQQRESVKATATMADLLRPQEAPA